MKRIFRKILLAVVPVLLIAADEEVSHKLFIIGDSTASIYGSTLHPRTGWGQVLQAFFNSQEIEVIDKALSGRSSKSYFSDPNGWTTVLNAMNEGDYLFIQFGHNDQKTDDRYTDPYTTYQEYLSIYIDSARAKGAYPVLLTSIHRNKWNGDLINDSHGDYPPAMRALATEKDVPLIDLHSKTKTLFESLGVDYTTNEIFMNLPEGVWQYYPDGNDDNTHLQENGAFEVCKLVVEGIAEIDTMAGMDVLENAHVSAGRVTAMADPFLSGTISGRGVYSIGQEVTLSVRSHAEYAFGSWTEADTSVFDTSSFSFTLTDSIREFVANMLTAYHVILEQSPGSHGILKGGAYYAPGTEVRIIATPKEGYRFVDWKKGEELVTSDSVYTFTMGDLDVTYNASFEEIPVSVVQHEMQDNDMRIYPNPNDGNFKLAGINAQGRLEIYSQNGQVLYADTLSDLSTDIQTDLPAGIYLLKITHSGNTITTKLAVE